jgi:hypothetical protein
MPPCRRDYKLHLCWVDWHLGDLQNYVQSSAANWVDGACTGWHSWQADHMRDARKYQHYSTLWAMRNRHAASWVL